MNIKKAIEFYNGKRQIDEPKMTQKKLGKIIMPKENEATIINYMSRWGHGHYKYLKYSHITKLCKVLKVDADFIMKGIDIKKFEDNDMEISGVLSILKRTGYKPNKLFKIKPMKTK